ncbi:Uncharacterised protein [Acinetobacter baumannii]|uniref:hypothetical protein n=2 Tax=Acinetobacter baumannii TaxID=470 RepID=UPI0009E13534|nr:hypothetical protein [Acinetobacter baumannii]ARG22330.1 hypothetical protein B7L42_18375 [Acinetobacter baumannii]MCQ1056004.1 hypothetical protein [Acinetobacter baumannii]MCT9269939.1 hypothetical protein [Acinetobacter baumannii]MCW8770763.1 hypothetical protein [Acinetobacter baumannii]MCZ3105581.1 hypothetical protein [Acinetobacter baumannii]
MIKLIALSLLFFSFQVVALTPEEANIKMTQQNSEIDNYLLDMYKVLDYKRDSLRIDRNFNALQAKISKTSDKSELTRLYCVEYRKLQQQSLDTNKKFNIATYKTDEIYTESLNELKKLAVACQNSNITKFHTEANDRYLKFGKYLVAGFDKRQAEYNQYNATKNLFEDMQIIRKRMLEETDAVAAQDILCIDYLGKMNELNNMSLVWNNSPLVHLRTQIKAGTAKLKVECQERGY